MWLGRTELKYTWSKIIIIVIVCLFSVLSDIGRLLVLMTFVARPRHLRARVMPALSVPRARPPANGSLGAMWTGSIFPLWLLDTAHKARHGQR